MATQIENKKNNLFILLGAFFLTNAIVAEFIGAKIFSLEQTLGIPMSTLTLWGNPIQFNMTAGVILWPFVFIMTDIINEYYGKEGVRKLTYIAVIMLIYSFIMVRIAMGLKGADFWKSSGSLMGIQNMTNAYNSVFGAGLMIIIGSLVAFLVGQLVDAFIFTKIKEKTKHKMIWLRATGSTAVSQFIDSFVVLFIAFYIGGTFTFSQVMAIGLINYCYKFIMSIILLPILYLAHNIIDKYLSK
jgi:uncharacterized integral membrane protein (TIGR00697 family)